MTATATADLYDRHGDELGCCDIQFRRFGARRHFSGSAVTIRVRDENVHVKKAVTEPGRGRVLVIDGGGSCHSALLGDNMAAQAVASGWEGIVVHGAVRDAAELERLDIGIVAVGSNPRRSLKNGTGERDVTLGFGGVIVEPGDRVTVDDDGVVVLPARLA